MDIAVLREKAGKWIGRYKYFVLILLLGVALMLIPGSKQEKENASPIIQSVEQTSLDEKLEQILTNIKGVGRVQVMLTVKTGEQTVYQTDKPSAEREDTVIISGSDRTQSGLIQQVISPTYRGAIVLCQGADSPSVCLAVKEAVSKVTGLDASQISVLKMK